MTMKKLFLQGIRLSLLGAAIVAFAQPSMALETEWVDLEFSQVRLVSANVAVGQAASVQLGLQIKMKSGFKDILAIAGRQRNPATI